ncbi:hypothetical protein BLNAU_22764 [Blattamonas nauphoetae]|uniref:USP domain-containing protein n=1 Tax=Blattamonas nauphoetae TaxID=2049346 RepID=A0ABQ9WS55_9EUKA|nr:hypothetical protein BLNAU_22764 [Blattamonas nauphoetae]
MRRTIKMNLNGNLPSDWKSPLFSLVPDLVPEDDTYTRNVSLTSPLKTRHTTPESKLESSGGRIEAFALVQSLDKPSATEKVGQSTSDHRYSLDMSPTHPTSGLPNIGSSCYLNSALQALAHAPILLHLLQTAYKLRPTPRPHKKTSNTHITQRKFDSMLRLSEDVQDALAFLTTYPQPLPFREVEQLMFHLHKNLGIVNPQFVGFKQNDSHEALLALLDVLDETTMPIASADDEIASAAEARADDASELVVVFRPNQPTAQRLALLSSLFASFQATPRTPIRDSCTGLLGGTVLCHSCGQARVSLHAFTALSLPLPPTPFFSFGHAHRIETLLAEMAVCSEVEGFVCSCCGRAGQTVTHGELLSIELQVLSVLSEGQLESVDSCSHRQHAAPLRLRRLRTSDGDCSADARHAVSAGGDDQPCRDGAGRTLHFVCWGVRREGRVEGRSRAESEGKRPGGGVDEGSEGNEEECEGERREGEWRREREGEDFFLCSSACVSDSASLAVSSVSVATTPARPPLAPPNHPKRMCVCISKHRDDWTEGDAVRAAGWHCRRCLGPLSLDIESTHTLPFQAALPGVLDGWISFIRFQAIVRLNGSIP